MQVTAVQPNGIAAPMQGGQLDYTGSDVLAYVACFDQLGNPVNSEFTASYHRERSVVASFGPPKYIGYLFSAGGGQTNFNYPAGGYGFNSFAAIGVGRYIIKYPWLNADYTHAQLTGYGNGSNYCHLTDLWITAGPDAQVDAVCFDNAGVLKPHAFLATFTNKG